MSITEILNLVMSVKLNIDVKHCFEYIANAISIMWLCTRLSHALKLKMLFTFETQCALRQKNPNIVAIAL